MKIMNMKNTGMDMVTDTDINMDMDTDITNFAKVCTVTELHTTV